MYPRLHQEKYNPIDAPNNGIDNILRHHPLPRRLPHLYNYRHLLAALDDALKHAQLHLDVLFLDLKIFVGGCRPGGDCGVD